MNNFFDLVFSIASGAFWFIVMLVILGCSWLAYMYWTDELGKHRTKKLTTKMLIMVVIGIGTFVIAGGLLFGSGGGACPVYGC